MHFYLSYAHVQGTDHGCRFQLEDASEYTVDPGKGGEILPGLILRE